MGATASGAGTANCNQHYTANGLNDGKTKFQGDTTGTVWIGWNSTLGAWCITNDTGVPVFGAHYYYKVNSGDTPPLSGYTISGGDSPAPTLVMDAAAAGKTQACTGVGGG